MLRLTITLTLALVVAGPAVANEFVATRTLRVGAIVQPGDVRGADRAGALPDTILGREVRRAIYAGHAVTPGDLGPPTLVRRNETVVMTYRAGRLDIRSEGRALSAGGAGETVDVLNLTSRIVVRATVTGQRRVEVRR